MSSPPFSTAAVLPTELAFLSLFPQSDSESEEESSAPPKLSSKEERIQRAIDQGKASYNWDQAETKFGWFADEEILAKKTAEGKVKQRNREHVAVSAYHRQRYQECLDVCSEILAPEGTDNREILDLALRACLKLKDAVNGETLARGCRSKWITTMHLAHTSGQVLLMAGLYNDSFKALLCAISPRALQYPHLLTVSECLTAWSSPSSSRPEPERLAASQLLQDVSHATSFLSYHFDRPLFSAKPSRRENALKDASGGSGEEERAEHVWLTPVEVDSIGKVLELDGRTMGRLQGLWLKMLSAMRVEGGEQDLDEEDDGGVRNL
ncbi:hypothetical protein BDY24DRAFT_402561 [Mrakia frigida]|uniref:uncharacterized protein n=1 Tax=Mrakia frigida TaxID=29902 RepID=UPI003FCC1ED6